MDFWKIALIILLIILCVLYLILIPLAKRKAIKKQNNTLNKLNSNLKVGDKVVLIDGIVGKIISLEKEEASIEIAKDTVVRIKRMSIVGVEDKKDDESMANLHTENSKSIKAQY